MRRALVVLLGACSAPELPASTKLAANIVAADVHADQLFWAERADQVVVHGPAGALWQRGYFDQRVFYLVAGDEGVVVSSVNVFENCGDTFFIRAGGAAEELPLVATEGCAAEPLDVAFGGVLYEVRTTSYVARRYDLAARAIEPAFDLGSGRLWQVTRTPTEIFAFDVGADVQQVVSFLRDRPRSLRVVVGDVHGATALAVLADHVYWVSDGDRGIVQRAPTSASDATPEIVAELGVEIHAVAAVRDALWLAPQSRFELWRLDRDGTITRFDVPYLPMRLEAVGDQLAVITAEPYDLLLQPLD